LKRKGRAAPLYSDRLASPPIDKSTGRFLDLVVLGDRADAYRCSSSTAKLPAFVVPALPDMSVAFRAWVSGSDYDLEATMRSEARPNGRTGGFLFDTFKVGLEIHGAHLP